MAALRVETGRNLVFNDNNYIILYEINFKIKNINQITNLMIIHIIMIFNLFCSRVIYTLH